MLNFDLKRISKSLATTVKKVLSNLIDARQTAYVNETFIGESTHLIDDVIKGAVTDTKYFARSKFSRSLVHKKNFSLLWQVVFKLRCLICQARWDTSVEFE